MTTSIPTPKGLDMRLQTWTYRLVVLVALALAAGAGKKWA